MIHSCMVQGEREGGRERFSVFERDMEGRGGCCIARYAGGGAYDMSKVDQIMLRFRPIAPKPISGGSSSSSPEKTEAPGRSTKGKRRSPGDGSGGRGSRKKRGSSSPAEKKEAAAVTLPLLPETPVGKHSAATATREVKKNNLPIWMSFGNKEDNGDGDLAEEEMWLTDRMAVMGPRPVRVVGSCVTVECVTDAWVGSGGGCFTLGSTDEERRRILERDTCPGFLTDAWNRVTWTNGAYRRMVAAEEEGEGEEEHGGEAGKSSSGKVVVWVVIKERVPWTHVGFTCRVRVQYTCGGGRERRGSVVTLPCDAWRMDGGGFAWRLDVDAALSLGR